MVKDAKKRVVFISTFPPRKCGIATFTSDLIRTVGTAAQGEFEPLVVTMRAADFLLDMTLEDDHFSFIGCKGWYERAKTRAAFDQPPAPQTPARPLDGIAAKQAGAAESPAAEPM